MNEATQTDTLLERFTAPGNYITDINRKLVNKQVCDRFEYEKRIMNYPLHAEDIQVLRYLAKLTYSDYQTILKAAAIFRAQNIASNIITDADFLKKVINRLVDIGMVYERRYMYYPEDAPQGYVPSLKDSTPVFYMISGLGVKLFRMNTHSTEYIEDTLYMEPVIEIERRVASNNAVFACQGEFKGAFATTCSHKIEGYGRMPLYGRLENENHLVLIEPVFFGYDHENVLERDFNNFLSTRAEFLKRKLSRAEGKKKSIVFIVEKKCYIKSAIMYYRAAVEEADACYVTTEHVLSSDNNLRGSVRESFVSPTEIDFVLNRLTVAKTVPIFFE